MVRIFRKHDAESGSALLEFAFVGLVFLTMLFGIIDIGRCLFSYNWVSNSARLGTRYMMVRGIKCNPLLKGYPPPVQNGCPATNDDVTQYIKAQAIGIDQSQVFVTATCITGAVGSPPPCGSAPDAVKVQVRYHFTFLTSLILRIQAPWDMTSVSQRTMAQ